MKRLFIAVALAVAVASAGSASNYEPMAPFDVLAGKTFRATWTDPGGKTFADVARYEFILGGKALQSTHRIEGGDYGGRTIYFYDEATKSYVFHYFTTAGFHTFGEARFENGVLITTEKVSGHSDIAQVDATTRIGNDGLQVDVVYIGKDGKKTPGGSRRYEATKGPGPEF
jgi:hypothetical protein